MNQYISILDALKSCMVGKELFNSRYSKLDANISGIINKSLLEIYNIDLLNKDEIIIYKKVEINNKIYYVIIPFISFKSRNMGYTISDEVKYIIRPVTIPIKYNEYTDSIFKKEKEFTLFIYPYNKDMKNNTEDEYNIISSILHNYSNTVLSYSNTVDMLIHSIILYTLFKDKELYAEKSLKEFSENIIYLINLDQYPITKKYYIFNDKSNEICELCKPILEEIATYNSLSNIALLYGKLTKFGELFRDIIKLFES